MVSNNTNFKTLDNNLKKGVRNWTLTFFMMLFYLHVLVKDFWLIAHFLMLILILHVTC